MEPLISVIIPIYNLEDYIDKCVGSIVRQTYQKLEIILVDDGSTDGSGRICDLWRERDGRIRVVHQPNRGVSAARNAGLDICKGEAIAFVDPDDWIESEMYEKLLSRMNRDNSDIAICSARRVDDAGKTIGGSFVHDTVYDAPQALSELIKQRNVKQIVGDKLYKRAVTEDFRFEEGKAFEDVFWMYQAIGHAGRISLTSDVFFNHYMREGSATHTAFSVKNLDALDGYEHSCEYIKENYPDLYDDVLSAYMGYCMNFLQKALKTGQDEAVIKNILSRFDYRKTGNPTRNLSFRHKVYYQMFFHFPVLSAKTVNLLGK